MLNATSSTARHTCTSSSQLGKQDEPQDAEAPPPCVENVHARKNVLYASAHGPHRALALLHGIAWVRRLRTIYLSSLRCARECVTRYFTSGAHALWRGYGFCTLSALCWLCLLYIAALLTVYCCIYFWARMVYRCIFCCRGDSACQTGSRSLPILPIVINHDFPLRRGELHEVGVVEDIPTKGNANSV